MGYFCDICCESCFCVEAVCSLRLQSSSLWCCFKDDVSLAKCLFCSLIFCLACLPCVGLVSGDISVSACLVSVLFCVHLSLLMKSTEEKKKKEERVELVPFFL